MSVIRTSNNPSNVAPTPTTGSFVRPCSREFLLARMHEGMSEEDALALWNELCKETGLF